MGLYRNDVSLGMIRAWLEAKVDHEVEANDPDGLALGLSEALRVLKGETAQEAFSVPDLTVRHQTSVPLLEGSYGAPEGLGDAVGALAQVFVAEYLNSNRVEPSPLLVTVTRES